MDKFAMPDQLPATVAELEELAAQAQAEINVFLARNTAGEQFSPEDAQRLEYLCDSRDALFAERDTVAPQEQAQAVDLNTLLDRANPPAAPEPPNTGDETGESSEADAAEVVAEAEQVTADAAEPAAVGKLATGGGKTAFVVTKNDIPTDAPAAGEKLRGWDLLPSAPEYAKYSGEKVGFVEIARSIASVSPGSVTGPQRTGTDGGRATQAIARLQRPRPHIITDPNQVHAELTRITSEIPGHGKATAKALVAAGGWCAPSEQVYTFCGVTPASDLISVPESGFDFSRGGVRVPVSPDISALLDSLWHFTEAQLQAVDGQGNPTAVKELIELPCPDEFLEWRLEAIGWAAKAGILQRQAWPEAIENALEQIQVAHQHRVSQLTIGKMVAGSGTAKVAPTDLILGATSGSLNALAMLADNLRFNKGLSGDATIEGVAPVWFRSVLRADLAMREGKEFLAVTNAEIDSWLAVRDIYLQYVVDWQTRGVGQPGHMETLQYPGFVDVLLYPAGTWFRELSNIITLGVQYPLQQLQLNQYTHVFTEDSIQVGKRCDQSVISRLPLCVNGAVGARESITCSYTGATTLKATVTIGGSAAPTGGSFPLTFAGLGGKTATIAWNSTSAAAKTALGAMDDNIAATAFTVTGGALPGTALTITYPAELGALTASATGLTGGTGTTVTVS